MPETMGVALMIDMLAKNARKQHEFEDLRRRSRLPGRLAAAAKRFRIRWIG